MSRPKEINREEIKDYRFQMRVTKEELNLINKKAKKLSLSSAAYARMVLLGDFKVVMSKD